MFCRYYVYWCPTSGSHIRSQVTNLTKYKIIDCVIGYYFTMMLPRRLFLAYCMVSAVTALSVSPNNKNKPSEVSRRDVFGIAAAASLLLLPPDAAFAFDNRISNKYDDRPKQRGSARDLGVAKRKDMVGEPYAGLKPCGAAPNCFCSTDPDADDDPEHFIPAWKWPKLMATMEEAFVQLEATIKEYQPGQGNIDGGGFQVVTSKPGYLYAQFEQLKNGFVDDVEFAVVSGMDGIQVRSSSRLGYLDFGVNAKRLNYIATALRKQGWEAEGVDTKTHPEYFSQNRPRE